MPKSSRGAYVATGLLTIFSSRPEGGRARTAVYDMACSTSSFTVRFEGRLFQAVREEQVGLNAACCPVASNSG